MRLPWQKRNYTEVDYENFFLRGTVTGKRVDATTALASSTLAAVIAVRCRALSSLPVDVRERVGDLRKDASKHPSHLMFTNGPNDYMTWAQFMRWQQLNVMLSGNAYAELARKGGRVVGMQPIIGRVEPKYENGRLYYIVGTGDDQQQVESSRVVHFKNDVLTPDGLKGRSVVELAREAIGLDISAEEFLARVLSQGTHMGVVLETDEKLTTEQLTDLKEQLKDGRGVTGAGKGRIFQSGLKAKVLGMTVKEADLTDQRRFVNERISAIAGVPLIFLNDLTRGTYSNTEQQDLAFAKHCVAPIIVDLEQTLNRTLFTEPDRYFVKFNLEGLVRGDYKTRVAAYGEAIRSGWMSPNEVRALEDMDPYPGGDEYHMQAQMTPVEDLDDVRGILAPVVESVIERIRRHAEHAGEPAARAFAHKALEPVIRSHTAAGIEFDPEAVITQALERSTT